MTQLPHKALLLENIHKDADRRFTEAKISIERQSGKLTPEELAQKIVTDGIHVVAGRTGTQMPRAVFEQAKDLLAVGIFSVGLEKIDRTAALEHGVPVFNAPFSNSRSVAELVIGSTVALLRRVPEKSRLLQEGVWNKSVTGSREVRGKTLGIIGYGVIGKQVSDLAERVGMKVIYADMRPQQRVGNAESRDTLDELLKEADVLTLHVDGSAKALIGDEQLQKMKPGSILINCSRGPVVDLEAVKKHLESGHLGGAHIDVFPKEPNAGEPFESPLSGFKGNLLLTPHIGGNTEEAQQDAAFSTSGKLTGYITEGSTVGSVNFPEVSMRRVPDTHRFTHIHKDREGTIANISKVLAEKGVNISGQALHTKDRFGYAIFDINQPCTPELLAALQAVPGTIRVRALY